MRIVAPQGVVDIEVTNSPEVSVAEPQSVPSRISVVLVEEAKVGALNVWDAHVWIRIYVCWLEWRPVDPVGPSDSEPIGTYGLYAGPVGQRGTQSLSDSEPVGPDGPYVGPVGPSDSEPVGPDGPYVGPVSPSDSEPAGSVGPYVAGGPVGLYGTLSPLNSDPAGPVGPYVAGGPVGPI